MSARQLGGLLITCLVAVPVTRPLAASRISQAWLTVRKVCTLRGVLVPELSTNILFCAEYERAAVGLGAEQLPPPLAMSRALPSQAHAARLRTEDNAAARGFPGGDALSKLKAARARSRSAVASDGASASEEPPAPSPPPRSAAESYAEKRRAAALRASVLAAARRAAAQAAEAKAIAELPELEQLHLLSLARDRAAK